MSSTRSTADVLRCVEERLRSVNGVLDFKALSDEDRKRILEAEAKAEDRPIMGMCRPFNLGLRETLERKFAFALVVDTSEFMYPHHPHMKLMCKGEIVGEQVLDGAKISELRKNPKNVFLWDNFVIYYDRVSEVTKSSEDRKNMQLIFLPRGTNLLDGLNGVKNVIIGVPSVEGDALIKKSMNVCNSKAEIGTCIIGFDVL